MPLGCRSLEWSRPGITVVPYGFNMILAIRHIFRGHKSQKGKRTKSKFMFVPGRHCNLRRSARPYFCMTVQWQYQVVEDLKVLTSWEAGSQKMDMAEITGSRETVDA